MTEHAEQLALSCDLEMSRECRLAERFERAVDEVIEADGDFQEMLSNSDHVLKALQAFVRAYRNKSGWQDEADDAAQTIIAACGPYARHYMPVEDDE